MAWCGGGWDDPLAEGVGVLGALMLALLLSLADLDSSPETLMRTRGREKAFFLLIV